MSLEHNNMEKILQVVGNVLHIHVCTEVSLRIKTTHGTAEKKNGVNSEVVLFEHCCETS